MRKRVFRYGSTDDDWKFTGGIFLIFKTPEAATKFMNLYRNPKDRSNRLTFNGDTLSIKWQREFYEDKGKFRKELSQARRHRQESMDE